MLPQEVQTDLLLAPIPAPRLSLGVPMTAPLHPDTHAHTSPGPSGFRTRAPLEGLKDDLPLSLMPAPVLVVSTVAALPLLGFPLSPGPPDRVIEDPSLSAEPPGRVKDDLSPLPELPRKVKEDRSALPNLYREGKG